MKYRTGNAKKTRDEAIRKFAFEYPHYTDKEVAKRFGLERSTVTRILKAEKQEAVK